MRAHTIVVAAMLAAGCTGSGIKPSTDSSTTVDSLDRTPETDSNQTGNKDAGRDTADTGTRKSYPSGG